jgi:hypothetical protein
MVTVAVVDPTALMVIGDAVMCNPLDQLAVPVKVYGTVTFNPEAADSIAR